MWTLLACTGPNPTSNGVDGPVEEVADGLQFHHLQAKGTHNSYHVQTTAVDEWEYTHESLDVQLGEQGVRQFELDLNWDADAGAFRVYHVPLLDEGTTCAWLVDCLSVMRAWSDANPDHHPLLTLLEPKTAYFEGAVEALEAEIADSWTTDRLVTPDLVRGEGSSLLEDGWPTLEQLRGAHLLVLHDGGEWRDALVARDELARGSLVFPDAMGDLDPPWAAVHTMNDPYDPRIEEVVAAGHLVRTRADDDPSQVEDGGEAQRDAAFASGAHFVSTDFPAPVEGHEYVVVVPGGTPSRCNPRTAPQDCTSEAIEHLE